MSKMAMAEPGGAVSNDNAEGAAREATRLAALRRYCVLDTGHEARFDDLARLAARICGTPVSLVSLVDANRLFFKAAHGLDVRELPYPDGFCGHAIRQRALLEIPDTHQDLRFARHPLVLDAPHVRFYAGAPFFDDEGNGLGTLCVLDFQPRQLSADQRDMLGLLANQVMAHLDQRLQAMRDPLTGLYNRRLLEESLHREIVRAMRNAAPIGIMAVDVDHFKQINDSYGHEAGDAVLRAMARALMRSVREEDVVCRAGGEEFVIILPGIGKTELLERADRVRRTIEETAVAIGARTARITVSIGVANYPEHGVSEGDLLRAADNALYAAKAAGRNRVSLHA
jgi:diguanylate cyclase (GGDEF)-like protein